MPDYEIEKKFDCLVAGVDEAGRGPWAGPVVSAAVILDVNKIPSGLNDSKKLSKKKRELIYPEIIKHSMVGIGVSSVEEIDNLNILQASKLSMVRAIKNLPTLPGMALIDGNQSIDAPCDNQWVIKGDSISLSIAAASIVAKITRDNIMEDLHQDFPDYGWNKNSGYGTKLHQESLKKFGITNHHRKSFAPIKKLVTV